MVQLLTVFGLLPGAAAGLPLPAGAVVLLLLLIASLAILMSRGRWTLVAGVGALMLSVAAAWLERRHDSAWAAPVGDGFALVTLALLITVVFRAVFGPGRFTGHRVRGAFVLYLNVGLVFTLLHRMMAELVPGAYSGLPDIGHRDAFRAAMEYFSFVTLTSVGYGDIAPVHPLARSLATLEAAVGQLLPATLIARAVTLAISGQQDKDRDKDSPGG